MAIVQNIPLNESLRLSNPKVNQNFQNLNTELGNVDNKVIGHINSTAAHKAEDITYTGLVPGTDVKEAIDNVNTRISKIVAQSGDDITEIVDARGEYDVLGDRLNAFDEKIVEMAYNVKTFGAKGDGITDDTTAIKNVFAAVAEGGVVYFPPGEYLYSDLFSPPSNIKIEGVKGSSIIKMMPDALPTFGFINVGNVKNVFIQNLTFIGNKIDPTNPGQAEPAVFFLNGTDILIENCEFTGYMGIGVAFQGGANTRVVNCNFYDHGQNLTAWRGQAPKAVPAVWAAYGNTGTKVINCNFYDCRWSAVFLLCQYGEVKGCQLDTIGESGIYSEYSQQSPTGHCSVTNNKIRNCYQIDVTACGIEWATPYSVIADNIISETDADGIAVSTTSFVTVRGNEVNNANLSGNLQGMGIGISMKGNLESIMPTAGRGVVIEANTCWDDSTTEKQKHGIGVISVNGGSPLYNCTIANNQMYRNAVSDLYIEPGMMEDDTNIIRSNSGWLDEVKNIGLVSTSNPGQNQLKYIFIPAASLGKTRGVRIKAWGTVTGTAGTKSIYLKYDTNDSEFASITFSTGENGQWMIEAEIYNAGAINSQVCRATCYKNSTVTLFNSMGTVDSSSTKAISLLAGCSNPTDVVVCNGLVINRI